MAIDRAIKEWEEKTCVKFVPRTNETDYVEFFRGKGCYSYVGRIGGKHTISLGFFCWWSGVAQHEIGHALGFHHEQSRPDRDDYVDIIWDNIKEDQRYNFKKYSRTQVDSLYVPYDYDSFMHYDKRALARWPWLTTIRPKKSGVSIGFKWHLRELDRQNSFQYHSSLKRSSSENENPKNPDLLKSDFSFLDFGLSLVRKLMKEDENISVIEGDASEIQNLMLFLSVFIRLAPIIGFSCKMRTITESTEKTEHLTVQLILEWGYLKIWVIGR